MKRKVLALTVTVLAAGVASAFALAPSTQPTRESAQVAGAEPKSAPVPIAAGSKPTIEVRQAPVPILVKARPSVEIRPPADTSPVQTARAAPESPKAVDSAEPPKAVDPAGGAAAKAAVEADGYKGVKVLRQGDNGQWYAEGLRGRTKVLLIVDAQGNVSSQ